MLSLHSVTSTVCNCYSNYCTRSPEIVLNLSSVRFNQLLTEMSASTTPTQQTSLISFRIYKSLCVELILLYSQRSIFRASWGKRFMHGKSKVQDHRRTRWKHTRGSPVNRGTLNRALTVLLFSCCVCDSIICSFTLMRCLCQNADL